MELGERPFVCCESFNNVKKPSKTKIVHRNVKGKMADTYSYVSGELRCAFFPLFVDGILRNTNKKKCSKWSHQNDFAHFLVSTRPKLLLFSNKRKTVKIGQNAFTLNQGDTPLVSIIFIYGSSKRLISLHALLLDLPQLLLFPSPHSNDKSLHLQPMI